MMKELIPLPLRLLYADFMHGSETKERLLRSELRRAMRREDLQRVDGLAKKGACTLPTHHEDHIFLAIEVRDREKGLKIGRIILKARNTAIDSIGYDDYPMHRAAAANNVPFIKLLREFGADPNKKKIINGTTPLDVATEAGAIEAVEFLKSIGAVSARRP